MDEWERKMKESRKKSIQRQKEQKGRFYQWQNAIIILISLVVFLWFWSVITYGLGGLI